MPGHISAHLQPVFPPASRGNQPLAPLAGGRQPAIGGEINRADVRPHAQAADPEQARRAPSHQEVVERPRPSLEGREGRHLRDRLVARGLFNENHISNKFLTRSGDLDRADLKDAALKSAAEVKKEIHRNVEGANLESRTAALKRHGEMLGKKLACPSGHLSRHDIQVRNEYHSAVIKMVRSSAPSDQRDSLCSEFDQSFNAAAKENGSKIADQVIDKVRKEYGTITRGPKWQDEHRLARGSSAPIQNPGRFKMDWPASHSMIFGARKFHEKVDVVLTHLERLERPENAGIQGPDGMDMRPLMHAGVELAQRTGGDHITAKQAKELVNALLTAADKGDHGLGRLEPDRLRMVLAGMVAVWNPTVATEVALHLLGQAAASPDNVTSPHLQAAAEGLGIGMGWKGLGLLNNSVEQLHKVSEDQVWHGGLAQKLMQFNGAEGENASLHPAAARMLDQMRESQKTGIGWLLRLEAALPELKGKSSSDNSAVLAAVILLRKHHEVSGAADGGIKSEQAKNESASTATTTDGVDDDEEIDSTNVRSLIQRETDDDQDDIIRLIASPRTDEADTDETEGVSADRVRARKSDSDIENIQTDDHQTEDTQAEVASAEGVPTAEAEGGIRPSLR